MRVYMKPKIIALAGRAGSGKDFVAQAFDKVFPHGTLVEKFATPIREVVCSVLGINALKFDEYKNHPLPHDLMELDPNLFGMTVREFMLEFNKVRDAVSPYVYAYQVKKRIEYLCEYRLGLEFIFVTDLRLKEEYNVIKQLGGLVVEIDRPRTLCDWAKTYGAECPPAYKLLEKHKKPLSGLELTKEFGSIYNEYALSEKFFNKVYHQTETTYHSLDMDAKFINNRDWVDAKELVASFLRNIEYETKG